MGEKEKKNPLPGSSEFSSLVFVPSLDKMDNTTPKNECQDFKSLAEQYATHKYSNTILAKSYYRLGNKKKSDKVFECGSFLQFGIPKTKDDVVHEDKISLVRANFCKDRLCPLCSWKLSHKMFCQLSRVVDRIKDDYEFIFLTLTVPNVSGDDLKKTIDRLTNSLHKFLGYKEIEQICCGFFRALEITRNSRYNSKSYGTYHPHFHLLIAVPKDYFTSPYYLHQSDFLRLWQMAYKDNSISQVNVQKVVKDKACDDEKSLNEFEKGFNGSLLELAKYVVKPSNILKENRNKWTDECVSTLSKVLYHRRLIAYGGIFKEILTNVLNETEIDLNSNLTDDIEPLNDVVSYILVTLGWSCGCYKVISQDTISKSQMAIKQGDLRVLDIEVSEDDN